MQQAVSETIHLIREVIGLYTGPARIRNEAKANAEAMLINAQAEIARDELLQRAAHRLAAQERLRQQNLEEIVARATTDLANSGGVKHPDADWLGQFVQAAQDTSEPTIQALWAKILAGELERPESCSRRTLQMVRNLSREEAKVIADALTEICYVTLDDDTEHPFLNVYVYNRVSASDDRLQLYGNPSEGRRARDRILRRTGFISDDFACQFTGEGGMNPREYHVSRLSAKSIRFGTRRVVLAYLQPRLLEMHPNWPHAPHFGRYVELDGWGLSEEGAELVRLLSSQPNYDLFDDLTEALKQGGLSFVIDDVARC